MRDTIEMITPTRTDIIILKNGTDGSYSAVRASSGSSLNLSLKESEGEVDYAPGPCLACFLKSSLCGGGRGEETASQLEGTLLTSCPNHHDGEKYKYLL